MAKTLKPKILKALKQSIAHWKRLATGKSRRGESIYDSDCALCKLFMDDDCRGCPVRQATRLSDCRRTPWIEVRDTLIWLKSKQDPAFKAAAKKQLEFLQSLLPVKK